MENKIFPSRVKIDDKWYDVSEGWAGTFKLRWGSGSDIREYTAKEPFAHMNDFYHVFDSNENNIGQIDIKNRSYSGLITDIELSNTSTTFDEDSSSSSRPERPPNRGKPQSFGEWVGYIIAFLFLNHYIKLFVYKFWITFTAERKDWWGTLLPTMLCCIVSGTFIFEQKNPAVYAILIWAVIIFLPLIFVTFSRVRDAGKPWWWALIPGLNIIVSGFFPSN